MLDLCGLKCPLPALRVRKALVGMKVGEELRVLCTDPMAAIDIPHALSEAGGILLDHGHNDARLWFHIRKT